jgi:putative acetyltransferase
MESIDIRIVEPDNPDLHRLIDKLDEGLLQLYPAEGIFGVDFGDPKVADMVFCVAYIGQQAVGCGALRPLGAEAAGLAAELKRFFVDAAYRRRGIAKRLLDFLEQQASAMGFETILLETGPKQPEAIALYRQFGYLEIESYGDYAGCPHSYCMEKQLTQSNK